MLNVEVCTKLWKASITDFTPADKVAQAFHIHANLPGDPVRVAVIRAATVRLLAQACWTSHAG